MAAENKFLVHLNLNGNEIRDVVLQNLGRVPDNGKAGQMYYDTVDNKPKIFNGKKWVSFGGESVDTDTDTQFTYTFEKTDLVKSSTTTKRGFHLKITQHKDVYILGEKTGETVDTVVFNEDIFTTDLQEVYDYVDTKISTLQGMTYKGTVTRTTGLPTTDVKVGDTYKVAEAGTYAGQAAKVGDIFIASSATPTWDYIPSGDETEVIVYTATNPTLTATSGGICEWSISTTAASKNAIHSVAVYENSTGEQVYPNIIITGASNPTIKITIGAAVGTTISENTYTARYIY